MNVDSILTDLGSTLGTISLTNIIPAILVLIACLIVRKAILSILEKQLASKPQMDTIKGPLTSICSFALALLTVIIVCGCLNIPMTSLVALLSIFTLAISLAAQDVLSNLAGGLSILYSKPFVKGDYISSNGVDGTVEEVGLIYTRLITVDAKRISIPNKTLASSVVTDFSACKTRRVDLTISASYGDDVNTVLDALLENVSKHELVLQDPAPFVGINKYGTSSIEYVARVWCESANYWTVYFDLQKGFADMFKAKGIHMTYDHINVHIEKDQ